MAVHRLNPLLEPILASTRGRGLSTQAQPVVSTRVSSQVSIPPLMSLCTQPAAPSSHPDTDVGYLIGRQLDADRQGQRDAARHKRQSSPETPTKRPKPPLLKRRRRQTSSLEAVIKNDIIGNVTVPGVRAEIDAGRRRKPKLQMPPTKLLFLPAMKPCTENRHRRSLSRRRRNRLKRRRSGSESVRLKRLRRPPKVTKN